MARPKREVTWTEWGALDEAKTCFQTQVQMAEALGISHQALRQWNRFGIPAHQVAKLEELTGISRKRLRPDLFDY